MTPAQEYLDTLFQDRSGSESQRQKSRNVRKPLILLCLCDSPTKNTGFGRVAQEHLRRWAPHFGRIDIFGINHFGIPPEVGSEWADAKFRIFPAGLGQARQWTSFESFQTFLNLLCDRPADYTHVWIMQDTFMLSRLDFPRYLREACRLKGVRSLLYFPVDAPLEPAWTDIIAAVDVPVAYTEYGKREALKAWQVRNAECGMRNEKTGNPPAALDSELRTPNSDLRISVLPHGVDTAVFHPLPNRAELRAKLFNGWVRPDDVLLVNVNQNQPRKDLVRSLEIIAALNRSRRGEEADRGANCRYKLLLHCNPVAEIYGLDLEMAAAQLGLTPGREWNHTGPAWNGKNFPPSTDQWLNQVYNAADLLLSTSLGEGWGLSLTEALAAGCPIAVPNHTSCEEIRLNFASCQNSHLLPLSRQGLLIPHDNNRVRFPVDVRHAADVLVAPLPDRSGLTKKARNTLSWDRLAGEWLKLMQAPIQDQSPKSEVQSPEQEQGHGQVPAESH